MADYVQEIGGNTRLMIREGPSISQFQFFMQTSPNRSNPAQKWSWGLRQDRREPTSNSRTLTFRMNPGSDWKHMGQIGDMGGMADSYVDIRLTIYNSGLGFPTYNFTKTFIPIPPPPRRPYIFGAGHNFIDVGWGGDGGPGGASIVGREIWASNDGVPRWNIAPLGQRVQWYGLQAGTKYNLWARNANVRGWSGYGDHSFAVTFRVPDPPTPVTVENVQQTSCWTAFAGAFEGGTPVREYQLAYGRDPNTAEVYKSSNGYDVLENLDPGKTYYFWARARNDIGWSGWSSRSQVNLIAGALIPVDGAYMRALPYIKSGGTWHLARPWVNVGGMWRPSAT